MSLLYYASMVWLTPSLSRKNWSLVESIHYKALRLVVKDYKQRMSRVMIDRVTKRLPPALWMKFNAASYFLKLYYGSDNELKASKMINTYTTRRRPGLLFSYDASRSKIGRQITRNWIGEVIGLIKEPWTGRERSKDNIRKLMKRTFYHSDYDMWHFSVLFFQICFF